MLFSWSDITMLIPYVLWFDMHLLFFIFLMFQQSVNDSDIFFPYYVLKTIDFSI